MCSTSRTYAKTRPEPQISQSALIIGGTSELKGEWTEMNLLPPLKDVSLKGKVV